MRHLPETVRPYKTMAWQGGKIPNALFSRHNTKGGVWGTLHVVGGSVTYVLADTNEEYVLTAGDTQIIQPQEWHFLKMPDGVDRESLAIEITFHKQP